MLLDELKDDDNEVEDLTDAFFLPDNTPSAALKKCDGVLVGKLQRIRRDVKKALKCAFALSLFDTSFCLLV